MPRGGRRFRDSHCATGASLISPSRMADYLFVPQTVLDRWSEKGKVSVEGHVLTLAGDKAGDKKVFALTAAVRFVKMEAGEDLAGLLQKVKTVEALKQMGAEHYLESV